MKRHLFLGTLLIVSVVGLTSPLEKPCWAAQASPPVQVTDYFGTVTEVKLGVEDNGRIHIVWTGKPDGTSDHTLYYSSSTDGITWSPRLLLSSGAHQQIAVDDAHDRVHIIYAGEDKINHRTVVNGVVSPATVLDVKVGNFFVVKPQIAVDHTSGDAYALWIRADFFTPTTFLPMYSHWNGTTWSEPTSPSGDDDDTWSTIAVGDDGTVLVAGLDSSDRARAIYSTDGITFGSTEFVSGFYPGLEEDDSILATWAPFDQTFHIVTDHFLWPGSSEVYHFFREPTSGTWSAPENLTIGSTDGWSSPRYIGSVAGLPYLYATWYESDSLANFAALQARTASADLLGNIHTISDDFAVFGIGMGGTTKFASFLDANGTPHVAIGAYENVSLGVFYQRLDAPPAPGQIFNDGFESGLTSQWSTTVQ